MKPLCEYIIEAMGSNYDTFMDLIKDAKSNNGQGLILQFINNDGSGAFSEQIGYYSSMIIPFNVRNAYSFIKIKGANSQAPVDALIKKLAGKQVDKYTFTSSGFPHRGAVGADAEHTYTVKVFQFNVEDATKLTKKQLNFIERPNMYLRACSSGFFGITSIDKNYVWNTVEKYL